MSFTLKAQSPNGSITGYTYQAPPGLLCSEMTNEQVTCTWTLTPEQMAVESYSFCYDATDSLGLVSVRRCLKIDTDGHESGVLTTSTTTTTSTTSTTTTSTTTTTSLGVYN